MNLFKIATLFLVSWLQKLAKANMAAYTSTLPVQVSSGISGLKLKSRIMPLQNLSNSLSICSRFKYSRLSNRILEFSDNQDMFLILKIDEVTTGETWFGFGNMRSNTFLSWVLKDPASEDSYNIWEANKWHHFCLSYDSTATHMNFIKVCFITTVFIFLAIGKFTHVIKHCEGGKIGATVSQLNEL